MLDYRFISLPDGRRLSYMEFGKKEGYPVLYFHGSPSSCFEPLLIEEQLFADHNLRIIAPNRPGIGLSDFQKNRGFSDWPNDVISFADHLQLKKFAVFGNSGGAGYVMACASKIPDRLTAAVIVSGAWQMNLPVAKKYLKMPFSLFWSITDNFPFLVPLLLKSMKSSPNDSKEKLLARLQTTMAEADFNALTKNDKILCLTRAIDESLISKRGAAWDIRLYVKRWDFNFKEINFPIVYFHGESDKNVPVELVKIMVEYVSNAQLITYSNEAHLSTLCNYFNETALALVLNSTSQNGNKSMRT